MICVIDYGMGNLRSVSKAIETLGGQVCVSENPKTVEHADKIILPGVGEFGCAMKELKKRRLITPILRHIDRKKPFLGICLGLQLLFEKSEESPGVSGLSIIKGSVVHLKKKVKKGLKIPQMGWNQVEFLKRSELVKNIPDNSYFYFVHSFIGSPEDKKVIAGQTDYGYSFTSILQKESVFAVQFHPEKSQQAGLRLLKNFIKY